MPVGLSTTFPPVYRCHLPWAIWHAWYIVRAVMCSGGDVMQWYAYVGMCVHPQTGDARPLFTLSIS